MMMVMENADSNDSRMASYDGSCSHVVSKGSKLRLDERVVRLMKRSYGKSLQVLIQIGRHWRGKIALPLKEQEIKASRVCSKFELQAPFVWHD